MINIDSKPVRIANKAADIVIVNVLFLVTSIPVLTIGASCCSMHHVLYRMSKNEEGYVVKSYFKAFRENFKKATLLWLIMLPILLVMAWNVIAMISNYTIFPGWMVGILTVVYLFVCMVMMYVFPLQAHFENSIKNTIKNSVAVMLVNFPRSVLMVLVYLMPLAAVAISYSALIGILFCGFSLPALGACFLYRKVFEKMEANPGL